MMKAEFIATKAQDAFFNWEPMPVLKVNRLLATKLQFKHKKRQHPERDMQTDFFYWLGYKYPLLRLNCFAIGNGGSRHPLEAKNLQKQGVLSGVPDVLCCLQRGGRPGLFIEFKTGKNKLTPTQKQMFERLSREGYRCELCYSFEQATKVFEGYIHERS